MFVKWIGNSGKKLNGKHLSPVAIDSDLESYISLFQIYGKRFATLIFQLQGMTWNIYDREF